MNGAFFAKINGYPNHFWGWGVEDNALIGRSLEVGHSWVDYPKVGCVIDMEETQEMKTINDPRPSARLEKNEIMDSKYEHLNADIQYWKTNGLNSLDYTILSETHISTNPTIVQYQVDLQKKKDQKKCQHLFPRPSNQYTKLKEYFMQKWRNVQVRYV